MVDFSEEEIKTFIEKFKNIGFECVYSSYNKLDVTTDYNNYFITIHKSNEKYNIFVYRPDTFEKM